MRLLIAFFLLTGFSASAQTVAGDWQGSYRGFNREYQMIIHIIQSGNKYKGSYDIPELGHTNKEITKIKMTGDSLQIFVPQIGNFYNGKWDGKDRIKGGLLNHKIVEPMSLTRRTPDMAPITPVQAPKWSPIKIQTPKPVFDYVIEEVKYDNKEQNVRLAGTFTRPAVGFKFPVVLLITGSGAQDRDEAIGMHKPFWVIADYLTKHGIAVLRVDDRGVGGSTGNFLTATTADFATDVMAGIQYLKSRPDIDVNKIGLIGHSEGAIIAPYVAARTRDVAFVVMLAGPAEGGKKTMYYQAVTKPLSFYPQYVQDNYGIFYNQMLEIGLQDSIANNAQNYLKRIYPLWKSKQDSATVNAVLHGSDPGDDVVITSLVQGMAGLKYPWTRFFLNYDPLPDLAKVSVPVFALNGAKDEQVNPSNLTLIKNTLNAAGNNKVKTYEVPGVNHLFQHCLMCGAVGEYLGLEETFDEGTLKMIGEWIAGLVSK